MASLSQKLIDSCFPDYVKHLNLLELVVNTDSDRVPSLERQVALYILYDTMEDPLSRDELLQVFDPNSPQDYVPIIFGWSAVATRFVIENLALGDNIRFQMDEESMTMDTGAGGRFIGELKPEDKFYIQKVYEIVSLVLLRKPNTIEFEIKTPPETEEEEEEGGEAEAEEEEDAETMRTERWFSLFFHDFGVNIKKNTVNTYCLEDVNNVDGQSYFRIGKMSEQYATMFDYLLDDE